MRTGRITAVENYARGQSDEVPETMRGWLLGRFQVTVVHRSLEESEWRLRKAGSLIKLLSLTPQHCLHREQLMELLWPDLTPKAAANNLRYALYVARRVLEPTAAAAFRYLQLRDGQVALCPDGQIWIDVEAFEEAAATARRTHDPAAYRAAVDLYAGDLLPQDRYERWVENRREELRRLYLVLLVELAGLCEERDDFESATKALGEAVVIEPTHEEAHVGLMRLYAASGRRHEAILQYERLRNALSEELGTEPVEASRRLHGEIWAGQFSVARLPTEDRTLIVSLQLPPHNLPVARTSFVGREDEVVEVKRLLAMTRLLTLTGAGGCGKTRLALAVARDLVGAYPDGVWLVRLAALSEGTLVLQAAAAALEVPEQPNRPLSATLKDSLSAKNLLLVLDDCEHLIDDVVRLVESLLDSSPGLRILATSREALNVAGELVWRVPSLSVPDLRYPLTHETLVRFESVRLFVERAQYHNPTFVLTAQDVRAVADICRRLDGIPLNIELAAARIGTLSVKQIAARLKDPLKLLTIGSRTAPPRQRTLRGTLNWSYALLAEPEQKFFGRLSAFADGWTLEAAETVGAGDGIQKENVLDLLSRLMAKSLVVAEANGDGTSRYRMLEPIRQYGREKLEESREEAEGVRQRHAAFFLALAEEAEPELKGARQEEWLERLETEYGNLSAALSWALERGEAELGLRLSGALGEFWHLRGHMGEGRRWLEAALANWVVLPGPARPKALARAGCIAWEQGDYERSIALSEESLALSRELVDEAGVAAALSNLAWVALCQNELERASTLTEEAITLQRALGDKVGLTRVLPILGLAAAARHDYERAAALHEEGLALAREVGDNFVVILSLALGAFASLSLGDRGRARDLCAEGLGLSRQLKMRCLTATHLHVSAALTGSQGQPASSARLWGAAEALREAIGTIFSPIERRFYESYIATARAQLDEAAWEAAWAEGRAMRLEAIIECALSERWPAPSGTLTPEESSTGRRSTPLTRREREVAVLVGQGLTNRQISTRLVLSEHTVAKHVRKILKKLRLHSRAQIATWVVGQPLLPSNPD